MTAKTMLGTILGLGLLLSTAPGRAAQLHFHNMSGAKVEVAYYGHKGFNEAKLTKSIEASSSAKLDTATVEVPSASRFT